MMALLADIDIGACIQFLFIALFFIVPLINWAIKQFGENQSKSTLDRIVREVSLEKENLERPTSKPATLVMEAEVVEPVEEPAHTSIDTSHLSEHAAELGHLDDRPHAESIHDHFDYEVGHLGDSSDAVHENPDAEKLPAVAVTTKEIVEVFRNPERVREAIILHEILPRPESRWD